MSTESMMLSNHLILCWPFSVSLQPFPASGSFPVSHLFTSGGQSTEASASASVLPMNIQGWFPLGWTGLISLLSKGLSRVFSSTTVQKHQFFSTQLSLWSISRIFISHLCYVSSAIQWRLCSVSSSLQDPGWWSSLHLRQKWGKENRQMMCWLYKLLLRGDTHQFLFTFHQPKKVAKPSLPSLEGKYNSPLGRTINISEK